jgi:hypothetical protein
VNGKITRIIDNYALALSKIVQKFIITAKLLCRIGYNIANMAIWRWLGLASTIGLGWLARQCLAPSP